MKPYFSFIVIILFPNAVVSKALIPKLSINVKDGNFDGFSGFDPSLSWSTASSFGGLDIHAGLDATLTDILKPDIFTLPRRVWGKVSNTFYGWRVSIASDLKSNESPKLDLIASESELDLSFQMIASKTRGFTDLNMKKDFDVFGGRLSLNPRINIQSLSSTDVVVDYDVGSTLVTLQASKSNQKLTVSHYVNENNCIIPTLSTSGAMSLAWKKSLSGSNSITTLLEPSSVNVKWVDGAWTAKFNTSLKGISTDGLDVSVKRKLELF